ncbi:MAG: DUF1850 domain-containing protein [Thermomicrobiales bacterium]
MLFAALAVLAVLTAPGAIGVTVTDLTDGRVIVCQPMPGGGRMTLVYTHSMYGGEVWEVFVPRDDGRLVRVEMTTANAAAAEYYAYDSPVVREGNRYRVDLPPADYDEVVIRVDQVGRHRLLIGGETIDLLAVAGDGHRVELAASRVGIFDALLGRAC